MQCAVCNVQCAVCSVLLVTWPQEQEHNFLMPALDFWPLAADFTLIIDVVRLDVAVDVLLLLVE